MKNVFTLLLLFCFQQTFAEKLIFQNNNEQVDITGFASIDNQTGDITVVTVGEHEIINVDTQPVILGFYPSDYDITEGTAITVNWSVAFANSCNADVTSGAASWSGNKNANTGEYVESGVNVSQLPATLRLVCSSSAGMSTTKTILLTEQTGGGGGGSGSNPAINSFTVNSQSPFATVGPSTSATVAWNTTDVSNCTASANPAVTGWSGSKATSGSQPVTISANTELKLECGGLERTVTVTYTQNSSCSTNIYPAGVSIVQATYQSINDNEPFGVSTNTSFLLDMSIGSFHSLSGFKFDQVNARRRVVFSEAPTNFRLMSSGTMSISECPGDFTSTAACVIPVNNGSTVLFSTRASDTSSAFCKLDPTKTYYANYIHSPNPGVVSPSCASSQNQTCAMFYTETELN